MKQVVCGNEKGVLIPRKDMIKGLRRECEVLKGQVILSINMEDFRAVVYYVEEEKFRTRDYVVMDKSDMKYVVMNINVIKELFKIHGYVTGSEMMYKVDKDRYLSIASTNFPFVDRKKLYYFIHIGEPEYSFISGA